MIQFFKRHKKIAEKILWGGVAALLFFVTETKFAHASLLGIDVGSVLYSVIGKIMFGVSYIISLIAGIAITIEAWIIGFFLQINTGIITSPPVKFGFPVMLSIANLGFVLAIIVIALATILRNQQYGIKQLIWKLIMAAILVNFSLAIAGVFLNFSDGMSLYFLRCIDPGGGGCSVAPQNGLQSFNNFATSLAGAFNPQKEFLGIQSNGVSKAQIDSIQAAFTATGEDIGALIKPVISLVFVVFSLLTIVITLGTLIVMLIVRYVYLGILLILMPLVWLCYVIPSFNHLWKQWWDKFIKYTFFPPLVIFFLYVALKTAGAMQASLTTGTLASYMGPSNTAWTSVSNFFTGIFAQPIQQFLQTAVLIGLMLGGIIAADRLSITGAKIGTNAMSSVRKGATGYLQRRGVQLASSPFRTDKVKQVSRGLQKPKLLEVKPEDKGFKKGAKQAANFLEAATGIRFARQKLGAAAQGIEVSGGEKAIEARGKALGDKTTDQLIVGVPAMGLDFQKQSAALQRIGKEKRLDEVPNIEKYIGGKYTSDEFGADKYKDAVKGSKEAEIYKQYKDYKDIEATWKRYGQGKQFEELRTKAAGGTFAREATENEDAAIMPRKNELEQKAKNAFASQPENVEFTGNEITIQNGDVLQAEIIKEKSQMQNERAALQKRLGAERKRSDYVAGNTVEVDLKNQIARKEAEIEGKEAEKRNLAKSVRDARAKNETIKEAIETRVLPKEEKTELNKKRSKLADNQAARQKISNEMDAEDKADSFDDRKMAKKRASLEKDGKPIPAHLEEDSIKKIREAIIEAMAKGASPAHMQDTFKELSKRNLIPAFEKSVREMEENNKERFKEIQKALSDGPESNQETATWIHKPQSRDIVDLPALFDIKPSAGIKEKLKVTKGGGDITGSL